MICPNQPLHCDAYNRFGSAGDPLRWYSSQPAKCGPLTSQRSRLPSDVRMNAPLRVPTNTRIPLIAHAYSSVLNLAEALRRFDGSPHGVQSSPAAAPACSQLTIHGIPNRSTTIPNRAAQKVFCNGICTLPPCSNSLKIRSPSATSFTPTDKEKPAALDSGRAEHQSP